MSKQRDIVALKAFTSLNYMALNAWIEYNEYSGSTVPKEVIYLEIAKGQRIGTTTKYNMKEKFSLKFSSFELRKLRTALYFLRKTGNKEYIKNADPKKGETTGGFKTLTLNFENPKKDSQIKTYYINASEDSRNFSYSFDSFELEGLIEIMTEIANRTDEKLYEAQIRNMK